MNDSDALNDEAGPRLRAAVERTLAAGGARFRRVSTSRRDLSGEPDHSFTVGMVDFGRCRSCEGLLPDGSEAPTGDFEELLDRFSEVWINDAWYWYERKRGRRHWVRMRTSAPRETGPPGAPSVPLESLWGAGREVVLMGGELVRDVPTTRYRASLGLQEALAQAPRSARWRVEGAWVPALYEFPEFRADVWLDEEGRVRRMLVHHVKRPWEAPNGQLFPLVEREDEYELYDLGGTFEIPLPPRRMVRVSKVMAIAGVLDRAWTVARDLRRT